MFFNITKYSIKNILRNKFLTISTILVLTLLMFFINVLQILEGVSVKIISEINAKLNFSLYLKDGITKDSVEVSTLEKNIKEIDKDIVFDYKTKDKILLEMTQKDPELTKILESGDNPFPETIILSNIAIVDYSKVNKAIENQISIFLNNDIEKDYFANYKTQYERINQVTYVLDLLNYGIKYIIIIFFVSIAIITYSVVSNFIYYYKDEIYITRLVGGAKSFIYGPFILQGIIYSIISFLISLSLFYILLRNLNSVFGKYYIFEIQTNLASLELLIFIFIGGLSGYLSSRKYLKNLD
ncbi:FtsX-like permease family protein [Candidatus Gracilibacteria bacterium]|nr:MAG: FtsX-like permease family protein [Candidatus Gracilibacteria bacterium]